MSRHAEKAVRGSEPPLCMVHSRLNQGVGEPRGNQYALKHGFYRPGLTRSVLAWTKRHGDQVTIEAELSLVRSCLLRLAKCQIVNFQQSNSNSKSRTDSHIYATS